VSFEDLSQIRSDDVQIQFTIRDDDRGIDLTLFDKDQRLTLGDGIIFRRGNSPQDAAHGRGDDMLHLHRFHHDELLALGDNITFVRIDRHDRALHRRPERNRVLDSLKVIAGQSLRRMILRWRLNLRRCGFPEVKDSQRIAGINLRAYCPRRARPLKIESSMRGWYRGGQLCDFLLDETGMKPILAKIGMLQQRLEKSQVRRDAFDAELAQRSVRLVHCFREIR